MWVWFDWGLFECLGQCLWMWVIYLTSLVLLKLLPCVERSWKINQDSSEGKGWELPFSMMIVDGTILCMCTKILSLSPPTHQFPGTPPPPHLLKKKNQSRELLLKSNPRSSWVAQYLCCKHWKIVILLNHGKRMMLYKGQTKWLIKNFAENQIMISAEFCPSQNSMTTMLQNNPNPNTFDFKVFNNEFPVFW